MLLGEYTHTIDAKGRIILPADFRDSLGERFVITRGFDSCLFVYGIEEWEKLSLKLKSLPIAKEEARAVVRFFFSGAKVSECDRQGRFLVPTALRNYAVLEKEVVLIGVASRIEVWSKARWQDYQADIVPSVTELATNLAELGI